MKLTATLMLTAALATVALGSCNKKKTTQPDEQTVDYPAEMSFVADTIFVQRPTANTSDILRAIMTESKDGRRYTMLLEKQVEMAFATGYVVNKSVVGDQTQYLGFDKKTYRGFMKNADNNSVEMNVLIPDARNNKLGNLRKATITTTPETIWGVSTDQHSYTEHFNWEADSTLCGAALNNIMQKTWGNPSNMGVKGQMCEVTLSPR